MYFCFAIFCFHLLCLWLYFICAIIFWFYDQIVLFIFVNKQNEYCHKQQNVSVNRKIWSYATKNFNANRINLLLFAQFLFLFIARFFCLQKPFFFLWTYISVDKRIFLFSQFLFLFMFKVFCLWSRISVMITTPYIDKLQF